MSYPTEFKQPAITWKDVYHDCASLKDLETRAAAKGFKIVDFRPPGPEEAVINDDGFICYRNPVLGSTPGPRFILKPTAPRKYTLTFDRVGDRVDNDECYRYDDRFWQQHALSGVTQLAIPCPIYKIQEEK
jgi:hypothetical protein